jgi:hypothetical protein
MSAIGKEKIALSWIFWPLLYINQKDDLFYSKEINRKTKLYKLTHNRLQCCCLIETRTDTNRLNTFYQFVFSRENYSPKNFFQQK